MQCFHHRIYFKITFLKSLTTILFYDKSFVNMKYSQMPLYGHLLNTDTSLYYTQFLLSLGKESPHIISKFNQLTTDTLLIRTLSMEPLPPPPSVRINRDTKELILIELNLIIVPEENPLGR